MRRPMNARIIAQRLVSSGFLASCTSAITQFVPSREARVYNCLVGPASSVGCAQRGDEALGLALLPGSTAPTMLFSRKLGIVWGAKAKPSAPAYQPPGGFAVTFTDQR
jgi:hypothetical protein